MRFKLEPAIGGRKKDLGVLADRIGALPGVLGERLWQNAMVAASREFAKAAKVRIPNRSGRSTGRLARELAGRAGYPRYKPSARVTAPFYARFIIDGRDGVAPYDFVTPAVQSSRSASLAAFVRSANRGWDRAVSGIARGTVDGRTGRTVKSGTAYRRGLR